METRTRHPKLLSLQQLEPHEQVQAPMTPVASLADATAFSPRDPSAKLAASLKIAAGSDASPHRLALPSPTAAASDDEDDEDDEAATGPKQTIKPNTGRWTEAEHQLFLKGLETFPYRAWKKIATLIKTRTVVQIRTHAQKYYQKLEKEEARLKEREREAQAQAQSPALGAAASPAQGIPHPHQLALAHVAMHHHARAGADSAPSTPVASPMDAVDSPKRRSMMRKRKCAPLQLDGDLSDDMDVTPLPSLPKRMMREKKFARESHMSPKQKAPVASGAKFFGDLDAQPHNRLVAFAAATRSHYNTVLLTPSKAAGSVPLLSFPVHGLHQQQSGHHAQVHTPLPLDFGDASTDAMMLDLSDEKAMVDFPFPLDAAGLDQGLSSIDNDDLLQLTEEELDWFSTDNSSSASTASTASSPKADEEDETPFALGRFQFPALVDDDECLRFGDDLDMAGPLISAPSPMLVGDAGAALDDDFVLDPEKFLSSYLGPAEQLSQC